MQFTEEKLGKAERTELDPHLESLGQRTDHAKVYTERLVKGVEAVLVPNPAARLETFVADSMGPGSAADRVAGLVGGATGMNVGLGGERQRMSNLEYLGGDMVEAGNEFGPGTPYGQLVLLLLLLLLLFCLFCVVACVVVVVAAAAAVGFVFVASSALVSVLWFSVGILYFF